MTTHDDVTPWLGPAAQQMSGDQVDRFITVWDDVVQRYPDPDDQPLRDEVLATTVQYLLEETTPADIGTRLRAARTEVERAMAAARQIAILATEDGAAEATTAREIGVDRMALRSWRGKR
jgi:hypothetical protein